MLRQKRPDRIPEKWLKKLPKKTKVSIKSQNSANLGIRTLERTTLLLGLSAIIFCSAIGTAQADEWTGQDKALHFSISSALAMASYAGASLAWSPRATRLSFAGAVAISAGIAKEIYDLASQDGDASWRDLAWDFFGVAFGLLVSWSVDLILTPSKEPGESRSTLSFSYF